MASTTCNIPVADRDRITRAVQSAESTTSAELMPVIASASGRYDRAEDIVGLWFSLFALVLVWLAWPEGESEFGSWQRPAAYWQLVVQVLSVVVGFLLGSAIACRVQWMRRLVTPRPQMADEVRLRAGSLFFDRRVHHTAGRTGLLLYISCHERMAVILADQAIAERLGQPEIDRLCREFTQRIHDVGPANAFCDTIESLVPLLASHFPRASSDGNELSDVLVILP